MAPSSLNRCLRAPPLIKPVPRVGSTCPRPRHASHPTSVCRLATRSMHIAEAAGIRDLADGEYRPGDQTLEEGIERQLNYLLDEVGCTRPGFRLLEIGCGYGHLLRQARPRRGAASASISRPSRSTTAATTASQVYCCNYRDLLDAPRVARPVRRRGRQRLARALGAARGCARRPDGRHLPRVVCDRRTACSTPAPDARYVTTAIHVKRRAVHPEWLLTRLVRHPRGSDARHLQPVAPLDGRLLPVDRQLADLREPYFELELETDGTTGYSGQRLPHEPHAAGDRHQAEGAVEHRQSPHAASQRNGPTALRLNFIEEAWDRQFRGETPPTRLLRQTWRRSPALES